MAQDRTTSAAGSKLLPDPYYLFRAFTGFGFYTQWFVMMMNGSFVAMLVANWKGVFPTGTPVKTAWTGIPPVDFVLGLLVVFFGAINNVADLPDMGPFLMLADLVFALVVFSMMTVVEDRRNRKTGPLRSPAFWQFLWNWCGAASVLPVYSYLYLSKRVQKAPLPLPADQARALPWTALWNVAISLPILLPAVLGASPFQIQDWTVAWFLLPLSLGLFQDIASWAISSSGFDLFAINQNPVAVAYCIVGAVSAAVHVGVAVWGFSAPDLSWSRIYWPDHDAVRPGTTTFMTEGAMLFMQYDHVVIYLCVLGLGVYMLPSFDAILTAPTPEKRLRVATPLLKLAAMTAVAGPGAGLAWLLCRRENEIRDAVGIRSNGDE